MDNDETRVLTASDFHSGWVVSADFVFLNLRTMISSALTLPFQLLSFPPVLLSNDIHDLVLWDVCTPIVTLPSGGFFNFFCITFKGKMGTN